MKLYRAVDEAELADIARTGHLRCVGSAMGKYFADSPANVAWFGKRIFREIANSPFTIVQVRLHHSIADTVFPNWSDGMWTWFIGEDDLPSLRPDLLNSIPI